MVIVMTNHGVTVYNISNDKYEELIAKSNDIDKMRDSIVFSILKEDYSATKLYNQLEKIDYHFKVYYYDCGNIMKKKYINDIFDIKYFEDNKGNRWPSEEYFNFINKRVLVDEYQANLIKLDNQLNSCVHINTLFNEEDLEQFKRYYNKTKETLSLDENIKEKYYEVLSFSKLIMRMNKKSITSARLENNVFVIVTPVGLTADEEVKYIISEYKLSKRDCSEINKIFRRYLKEEEIKVDSLSEIEKYTYFDRAVREHVQNVHVGLEQLNGGTTVNFSSEALTWKQYKGEFFSKYGYPMEDFSFDWLLFNKRIVDSRPVYNGMVVPLIVESVQKDLSNGNKIIENFEDDSLAELDDYIFDSEIDLNNKEEKSIDELFINPDFIII